MDQLMQDLLFLTQRIPYPPIKGEKIRPLQILKYLRQFYNVHLGCLVDDPRDLEHVETVRALCKTSHFATLDRSRAKITCLRGLLTGKPLSVTFYHDSGLTSWVRRVLTELKPQAVFICSSNMAPYVLDTQNRAPVCLVDLADVDSEKWRAYAEASSFPMNWVHRREWRKTAALESRIAHECDWSTFVSAEEAKLFASLEPDCAQKIRAVSSGVDHAYFDPAWDQAGAAPPYDTTCPNYVFTGTMDYPPNVDAVTWFAEKILPMLHRTEPKTQFHIVGSSPAPSVQKLAQIAGVFVTGRVPDVRPYIAFATAGVAPMRIARGIQNKVLEAMAMARPVVVTPEALEGIDAKPGTEVILAQDEASFAAGCRHAAGPEGAAIGEAARRRVLADYVWAQRLRGFDDLLDIAPRPVPAAKTVRAQ
jgi:sugar transferase (PEP-CTERM/EpsH1 system associated)